MPGDISLLVAMLFSEWLCGESGNRMRISPEYPAPCLLWVGFCVACVDGRTNRPGGGRITSAVSAVLGGEPDYEQRFHGRWPRTFDKLFKAASAGLARCIPSRQRCNKERFDRNAEPDCARPRNLTDEFTLTLIGHGSFDGEEI